MNNIIKRKWNQNSMVIIEDLQGMAFQAESGGHTFQISGVDGEGNTVALSGTPAGVMLRSDGQDVTLTCSVSGGVVFATLPANAYVVPGRFGLTIFLTSDGQKTAIYAAVGTVGKTSSGTVAPPAGSDVVDLVNAIAAAVATIPASYTDLMASVAPTYSSSGLYAVGSYAWYNGKLYRCTTAITSGETWTSGHWTLANLGSDLVDLKSAINLTNVSVKNETGCRAYYDWGDYPIVTNVDPVDISSVNTSASGTWFHYVIPCVAGDVFHVKIDSASSTSRPWTFVDSNGYKKDQAQSNTVDTDITAPEGSAYLVLNAKTSKGTVYGGERKVDALETKTIALQNNQNQTDKRLATQALIDNVPALSDGDFEAGSLDVNGDVTSPYSIRTNKLLNVRNCYIRFDGIIDDENGRYCYPCFYNADKEWMYRTTKDWTDWTKVPDNAAYVRFIYGWPSASGETVEDYGFSNLVSDFALSIYNNELKVIHEQIDLIQTGKQDLKFETTSGKLIDYSDEGKEKTNANFHDTGFIEIPEYAIIIETNFYNTLSGNDGYAFYNASQEFISNSGGKCNKSYATRIKIPPTAKYIRLSGRISYEESGVDRYVTAYGSMPKKANDSYTVVMLGDSIIGNYNGSDSVPAVLEQLSGAKCYNCAFGGSNLATDTVGSINQLLLPFRGFKVIEAITENDYTNMDQAIADDPNFETLIDYYPEHVATLKSIDWSNVDLITMSWGTNDWGTSVKCDDNQSNLYDTDTIGGALRTALETLWATYPQIKVMICGPIWRGGTITSGELDYDSDNHTNARDKYLKDYSDKENDVAKEYHVPFVEMYDYTNFNKHTWKTYFPTSASNAVHPNAKGRYVIAKRYASFLAQM